jgi:hypothetical protein
MNTIARLALASLLLLPVGATAQESVEAYTAAMESQDGFVSLHWDAAEGRLLLEVTRLGQDFLYLQSLATGVGSNALGLDRGMIGGEYIARFERVGPKVFLTLQNPSFRVERARTEALARSVEESFPTSRVAAFDIVAEEDGRLLVDGTPFFLQDVMGVIQRLQSADQGTFRLDSSRSSIFLGRSKAFPENTEVEASLTLSSDRPGPEIRQHTPAGGSLTIRQHHSFVRLPDDGFESRTFDPRIGLFAVRFYDFGKSFDEDYVTRYAMRHRLQKREPDAEMSEPVEPVIYYMDPAIPEPYRTAFKEGGAWWNQVFEAAGFIDGFLVEDMPPDMDPLDARYHVIQWVHRTEAGSSIGPSFVDPRTGEIIKAAVRMDSHRSLADFNLYAGVVPATGALDGAIGGTPAASSALDGLRGTGAMWRGEPEAFLGEGGSLDWVATLDPNVTAEEFAMARRRQHSAHEIGHTLGLAHNFIAASYGRASVMDYPAPLIRLDGDGLDLTDAYRPGPGAYDTLAIRWAYTEFPDGAEAEGLAAIVQEGLDQGILFITNPMEQSANSFPDATTWINGSDVLDELERVVDVRRTLIDRFDERAVAPGDPMWRLNERFTPVYLHHRFTLGAAVKTVGGMDYRYAVRGDPLPPTRLIDGERQRRALDLLVEALHPSELAVPEAVLELMAPQPFGYRPVRVDFNSRAGPAFDQLGIARTLSEVIVGGVLHPARMARVAAFHQRDPSLPTPEEVVQRFVDGTWRAATSSDPLGRVAQRTVLDELVNLGSDADATVEARAAAEWGLRQIAGVIGSAAETPNPSVAAHRELAAADIERFLARRYEGGERTEGLPAPPGTPIGQRSSHPNR